MMSNACRQCGMPISENVACKTCEEFKIPVDDVLAMWAYREEVCDAVVASKFGHHRALAAELGDRLADVILKRIDVQSPNLHKIDAVVPVPSHRRRTSLRGGSGVAVIAETIAHRLRIPPIQPLRLTRAIKKQAWLDDQQRQENVRDAFGPTRFYGLLARASNSSSVAGRHILLVDDVLTTGATAGEVASTLRKLGAARITLAVVARSIRQPFS